MSTTTLVLLIIGYVLAAVFGVLLYFLFKSDKK